MDAVTFNAMEVRPKKPGHYLVTLYCFNKIQPGDKAYFCERLYYNGTAWVYGGYSGACYVCFIHSRAETVNGGKT